MKYPINAIWRNNDFDIPVLIVACYGEFNGIVYYKAESGTGIPAYQLVFEKVGVFQTIRNWFK